MTLAHFAQWATKCPGFALQRIDEAMAVLFIRDRFGVKNSAGRRKPGHHDRAAMVHLISLLRQQKIIDDAANKIPEPINIELAAFNNYMANVRGLAPSTCAFRLKHVQEFLACNFKNDKIDIALISTEELRSYVMRFAHRWSPVPMAKLRDSFRSYLRYRAFKGDNTEALIEALPVIASWKNSAVPKSLNEDQVREFLQAFDRTHPTGKRDYAIARCLLDLGLRGDEVTHLRLDAIDWRTGTVTISGGKGRRAQQLPLPTQTGKAIVAYLRNGRPHSKNQALFVRQIAPFDKPLTVQAVRDTVIRAFVRAGLRDRFCGTHVLRHTMAIRLQRSGASLKEIADLLRHKSFEATKIYARVDLQALLSMALPWPGSKL
jgi:site-specific recombinase XerD